MAKILKENNNTIIKGINDFFKLKRRLERFLTSVCSIVIITHIGACLWYVKILTKLIIL